MAPRLLTGLCLVPMDGPDEAPLGNLREGAIRIDGDRITGLGDLAASGADRVEDCSGLVALPGFVQGHVHYCQTLFRGLADDLPLMRWLRERIWPLEAAHDQDSTRSSAELSVAELLRGGTTTAQVMESVRHGEATLEVARRSGMTTVLGNCLMDVAEPGMPADFVTTRPEAMRRIREFHAATAGEARLHYAVSPRFILSCTDDLAREAAAYAREHSLRIHTHAGEHPDEVRLVRERCGDDAVLGLQSQGLLGPRTGLAHCVHTTPAERDALTTTGTAVLHCPSTNLKLGSGIAPIASYRDLGLRVALGADGAPCNNRLSMLTEIRQAALLQAAVAGPGAWPAAAALRAATLGGAEALGLEAEVGSLAVGKRADLVLFDLARPRTGLALPLAGEVASQLVFAAETTSIRGVLIGGEWRVRDGELTGLDLGQITAEATLRRREVLSRAGLAR